MLRFSAAAAGLLLCVSTGPLSAQMIGARDTISLTLVPSALLAAGQTYKIPPSELLRQLAGRLTDAGIIVESSSDAARVVVEILRYNSGPYLGFAKTARIEVQYTLQVAGPGENLVWTDRCEARAGVDVQDAPDRNRTAVNLCLTGLGARLAERLAGPQDTVLVN